MAILGDGERLAIAADIARIEPETAHAIAHRLRRMEILAGEDPFVFAHPLARRSIYHSAPESHRAVGHEVAAAVLRSAGRPPAEVAHHLAALAPSGSATVSAGLIAAADAASDSDSAETARWLRRALDEGAAEPPRAELLQRLGETEVILRDTAAIDHLREALDLTTDPARRARLGIGLSEVLAYAGLWEDAVEVMHSVEPDLDAETEELRVSFAAVAATTAAYDPARVHIFDELAPQLVEMANGPSWSAHAIRALLGAIKLLRGGCVADAVALVTASLQDGVLLADQGAGSWAVPQVLQTLVLSEEPGRALAACQAVDAAGRAAGVKSAHLFAAGYRGYALLRAGDVAGGEREYRRAMALTPENMAMIDSTLYFLYADALVERPSLADVAAQVETLQLEPQFLSTWSGAHLLWTRALLRLTRQNRTGAIADLREVGAMADALGFGPALVPWRSVLALALGTGARAEALALVETEIRLARATGLARTTGIALRAAGSLISGEPGLELLRESVAVLETGPSSLEHARALVALGSALRRARRPTAAKAPLENALELAMSGGAVRLAAHAREELGATAGRPPRKPVDDLSLTSSELRVARLAAAGASNREIAAELFISPKTVETHLSHVYAKFGLTGRGAREQLTSALAAYAPRL